MSEPIISVDPAKCRFYDDKATKCPKGTGEPACDVLVAEGCNRGIAIHFDTISVIDLNGCDRCYCGSFQMKPRCVDRCPYSAIMWKGNNGLHD